MISVLISISQSTRDYTELARRTQPTAGDLALALIDSRIDVDDLLVSFSISTGSFEF